MDSAELRSRDLKNVQNLNPDKQRDTVSERPIIEKRIENQEIPHKRNPKKGGGGESKNRGGTKITIDFSPVMVEREDSGKNVVR